MGCVGAVEDGHAPPERPAASGFTRPAGLAPAPVRLRRGCNRLWRRGLPGGAAARGCPQPHWAGGKYKTEPLHIWKKGIRGGGKTPVILYGGAGLKDRFTFVNYICKYLP